MWKEDAISVSPPIQEIGKEMGLKLGKSVHDKILPYIKSLKEQHYPMVEALAVAKLEIEAWRNGTNTRAALKDMSRAKVGACFGGLPYINRVAELIK